MTKFSCMYFVHTEYTVCTTRKLRKFYENIARNTCAVKIPRVHQLIYRSERYLASIHSTSIYRTAIYIILTLYNFCVNKNYTYLHTHIYLTEKGCEKSFTFFHNHGYFTIYKPLFSITTIFQTDCVLSFPSNFHSLHYLSFLSNHQNTADKH